MGETGKTPWGAGKGNAGSIMGEETLKSSCSSPELFTHDGEDHPVGRPLAAFPICSCREGVEKIFESLSTSSEEVAFGKTKVFIRSPKTVSWRIHLCLVGVEGLESSS